MAANDPQYAQYLRNYKAAEQFDGKQFRYSASEKQYVDQKRAQFWEARKPKSVVLSDPALKGQMRFALVYFVSDDSMSTCWQVIHLVWLSHGVRRLERKRVKYVISILALSGVFPALAQTPRQPFPPSPPSPPLTTLQVTTTASTNAYGYPIPPVVVSLVMGAKRGCQGEQCFVGYTASFSPTPTTGGYFQVNLLADVGALCHGQPRQWSVTKQFSNWGLEGRIEFKAEPGCTIYLARASVVSVVERSDAGDTILLRNDPPPPMEFTQSEFDAAVQKENQEAVARMKRDKEIAEEQERERRVRAAEREAREKLAEETAEGCRLLYRRTIHLKVSDLTVAQEQAIQSCRLLGLYRPEEQ